MSLDFRCTFRGVTLFALTLGDDGEDEDEPAGEALHDSTAAGHVEPLPAYDPDLFIRPRKDRP